MYAALMSSHTPFFPAWRPQLAPARLATSVKTVCALTFCRLEERFSSVLPTKLMTKGHKQRDRIYTLPRVFWCFLWQTLHPATACREVVRQVQALFQLQGGPRVCSHDGAYCQARKRLPDKLLFESFKATAKAVQHAAPLAEKTFLQARSVKAVDAATLTNSPSNRKTYPKVQTADGIGFPMMRVLVFFCVNSGALLARITGTLRDAELRLFQRFISQLSRDDIVLGDRGFGHFIVVYLLKQLERGVDLIGRSARKVDGRKRLKRLGRNDWLVSWKRPSQRSALLTPKQWKRVPGQLTVRIVRGSLARPGFRVRQVSLVTTLLDPKLYPASQILQAYLRRWRLELCFNDLKTTLQMEMLSCQSPEMIGKELDMHLIAYNLVRLVAAQAASTHQTSIELISFKGTLDALRQFANVIAGVRRKGKQRQLWEQLLRTLVEDSLPYRPNRREPRAVKKQKNKYNRLNCPRHLFRDPPKTHKSTRSCTRFLN